MGRAEKRAEERWVAKQFNKDAAAMRAWYEREIERQVEERTDVLFALFCLAMHETFGFGAVRCKRTLEWIDRECQSWLQFKTTPRELNNRVLNEVKLRLK